MKTISLNTDRVLIGSSNITYYGESLKTFGITGNPKIFELDKDRFNLNIYGSMNFTGSGRINLNGSYINLNANNVHISGSNINLDGNVNLNSNQDFNISVYSGGTIKLDNYDSNITLSGQKIDVESEIINLSGSEINIESDYLHIHKTGSNVEFIPYTGKSLILNGAPIVLNGSIEVKNSMNVSGLFSINGNSDSLQFREFSKIDCVSTDGSKEFIFGAQSSCFIDGNDSYIEIVAGYATGHTGSINIFSRNGDIKLNGSSIALSGTSINLTGSRIDLSGSVYLNGSLLVNGGGGGTGTIGSIWSGYSTLSIMPYAGGIIRLSAYNDTELKLSGSSIYFSGKNVSISGEDILINTPHLIVKTTGSDTKVNWYTGQTLILGGDIINLHGSASFDNDITLNGHRNINGSFVTFSGNGEGSMIISGYNDMKMTTTGSNANFKFGANNRCFIEGSEKSINIMAGYATGTTGKVNLFSRDGEVNLAGSSINITSGTFTIKDGADTYVFSGGSFVLQS